MTIVTTHYRNKRPPRRKKAIALEMPAVVIKARKRGPRLPSEQTAAASSADVPKSSIVTGRRRGRRFADVPDMTPEEHQRVGDLADALWRDLVRRATGKDQL